ncbi:MAG TPA: SRPBCC family protein [Nocardioidaceae bacterium]|nr:SRPBCC family protein [Nocardioidaceae bacterium]
MTGHVIHLDRQIYATPDQVWNVLTDIGHSADIIRSVQNVQVLDGDGHFDVGTRWREDRTLMGHRGTEELEVVEVHKPSHFAVRTKRERDTITMTYTLTPLGQGSTRLSLTLVDDMKKRGAASALAWTLWGEVSMHSTRRMLTHDLDDIATAAENVAIRSE